MFSFLSGMFGKGGGALRGATKAGLGNAPGLAMRRGGTEMGGAKPGGFMEQMGQRMRTPEFREGLAGMGAQMMGLDPRMGQAAVQGMQQRQLNNQLGEAVAPIQRSNIDPRQFLPQGKEMAPQLGVIRPELGAQPQGGGSWQDPRLQQLFGRQQSGPRY